MDSSMVEQGMFQFSDGGSSPTSTLQLRLSLIHPQLALNLYKKWHYLKDQSFISSINFGVMFEHQYHGAISYGPPNATELGTYWDRQTQAGWWEIKRLALSPECIRNSESRIIAMSIKLLRKMELVRGIVTYADIEQGHAGTIYKASGFTLLGMTAVKKDFVVNGQIQQRGKTRGIDGLWVPRSRKWLFIKQFDRGISSLVQCKSE